MFSPKQTTKASASMCLFTPYIQNLLMREKNIGRLFLIIKLLGNLFLTLFSDVDLGNVKHFS